MDTLTQVAAHDLLLTIKESHFTGLAGWTETVDRLVALRQMCTASDTLVPWLDRVLSLEERSEYPPWNEGERRPQDAQSDGVEGTTQPSSEDPLVLLYRAAPGSGLKNWIFHKYDADPYPSVPHGHLDFNSRQKLDAFQGWVYDGTRQTHREPKWKIVALWNDDTFRIFALTTIRFHIAVFPHLRTWRVPHPLKLPREALHR